MFQLWEVFGVVSEEERDEGVVGLGIDETDGPQIVARCGWGRAVLQLSVRPHPNDVGERLPGEDPFIISQCGSFEA